MCLERHVSVEGDFPAFPMLMTAYLEKNEIAHAREFYRKYIGKGFTIGPDIEDRLGVLRDAPAGDR
jgi:hypothetical protein